MIPKPTSLPIVAFSFIKKAFSHEHGATLFLAAPGSYGIAHFFKILLQGVEVRDLVIPLTIFGVLMISYSLVSIMDFYTGISASKKEHIISTGGPRGYIKSDKLWSSVWKFFGVILIASILVIFTLIFSVAGMNSLYSIFLFAIVFFFLVVILFDLHSIGENQERRYGTKPSIYIFLEEVTTAVKKGILKRITKKFE